nr:MAG TPA: hypothetical protein [Caudoviricetes sp.]
MPPSRIKIVSLNYRNFQFIRHRAATCSAMLFLCPNGKNSKSYLCTINH